VPEPLLLILVAGVGGLVLALLLWPDRGLIPRWRHRRAELRQVQKQDALKQARLYELEGQPTTRRALAGRLGIRPPQLTSLLGELEAAGSLTLAGEEIHLTRQGREEGARIIRAHRLWERHLADDTGFAETEWHELAERQEHRLSPAETEALARRLGQPASDPHGDPIPTADGEIVLQYGLWPGFHWDDGAITHVEDEPTEVYDQIVAAGLVPGAVVTLVGIGPEGLFLVANGEDHRLPSQAAGNIAVVPLPAEAVPRTPPDAPLTALGLGQCAEVVGLAPRCRGAERRRLLDLGLLPGTRVEAVMISPSGDPTAYRIRDALIALRREQAGLVRIARPPEAQS
jgi:DtxR family Mn-dependent transcriptional regulator